MWVTGLSRGSSVTWKELRNMSTAFDWRSLSPDRPLASAFKFDSASFSINLSFVRSIVWSFDRFRFVCVTNQCFLFSGAVQFGLCEVRCISRWDGLDGNRFQWKSTENEPEMKIFRENETKNETKTIRTLTETEKDKGIENSAETKHFTSIRSARPPRAWQFKFEVKR